MKITDYKRLTCTKITGEKRNATQREIKKKIHTEHKTQAHYISLHADYPLQSHVPSTFCNPI